MSSATATTASNRVAPVCQYGGQLPVYLAGFRIAINGYIVLNIYYDSAAPQVMIIESTQLGTRQVLSHYESPLDTIRRLYQYTPQQLPQLNTAFVTPYENQTWYELLDTYGPMFIGIENPIFQQAHATAEATLQAAVVTAATLQAQAPQAPQTPPPRTLTVPLPGAPVRVQMETNRPLHLRSVRRNLSEEWNALIPRKRTFTFMFEEEEENLEEERADQDEEEEEEEDPQEPVDYLELRSGTRIAKY